MAKSITVPVRHTVRNTFAAEFEGKWITSGNLDKLKGKMRNFVRETKSDAKVRVEFRVKSSRTKAKRERSNVSVPDVETQTNTVQE